MQKQQQQQQRNSPVKRVKREIGWEGDYKGKGKEKEEEDDDEDEDEEEIPLINEEQYEAYLNLGRK